MRSSGERALMEASMRRLGRATAPRPRTGRGLVLEIVFAPVYSAIPWSVKKRMVTMTSGVKGWRTP